MRVDRPQQAKVREIADCPACGQPPGMWCRGSKGKLRFANHVARKVRARELTKLAKSG